MSSLANALKDEIRRLARKEIKLQTNMAVKAATRHRREIAKLKRVTQDLERKIAFLQAQERKRLDGAKPSQSPDSSFRFSARSVQAQRRRTGLSAADYAKLVGVSPLTIYNWEHGKSRPRKEQLVAVIGLRGLGKREAQTKLKLLANGSVATNGRRRRKQ